MSDAVSPRTLDNTDRTGPGSLATARPPVAPVPHSFLEYVRSFGPGIVIVLTWLGAGDVVDMGAAGANYGYALIWVFVVAILFRFLFVSLIVRYHLCNQHGEGVLDGLARLHPLYAPVLFVAAIVMGHVYGSYMTRGVGEVCRNVFGFGAIWQWAVACNAIACYLVFRPSFSALELVFFFFLAVLSVSFVGFGGLGWLRSGRGRARSLPGRDARQAWRLRSFACGARDDRRGRRLADEPGVSVLPRRQGLARAAVPARAAVRLHARHGGDARAQPVDLGARGGVALSRPPHPAARGSAEPVEHGARRAGPRAVLRRDLRRDLHLDHRPRGRPGPARHARVAALARRHGSDHDATIAITPAFAGSPSRAWSRRSSGRCRACPGLSR